MSILADIQADVTAAMKARDSGTAQVLRLLVSALQLEAKESGVDDLADDAAIRVLSRQKKQCIEAAEAFESGGASERAAAERAQVELIERYLPAQLSSEELTGLVDAAIAEVGATSMKEMGQVMKLVMARAAGRADGSAVSSSVRERLGS